MSDDWRVHEEINILHLTLNQSGFEFTPVNKMKTFNQLSCIQGC